MGYRLVGGFKPYSESRGVVSDAAFSRNIGTQAKGSLLNSVNWVRTQTNPPAVSTKKVLLAFVMI